MKFFPCNWRNHYRYLAVASISAVLFIAGEMIAKTFQNADLNKYLFTYIAATSFYSLVGKYILRFVGLKDDEKKEVGNEE